MLDMGFMPDVEKIKVRSSANAEDIPGFDGAGLHDSFSANPEKKDKGRDVCQTVLALVSEEHAQTVHVRSSAVEINP